jgi:hypothetical protein
MHTRNKAALVVVLVVFALTVALAASAAEPKKATGTIASDPPKYIPKPDAILITEGFETAVPPAGWTLQATHTGQETWYLDTYSPHGGTGNASVQYDPDLVAQSEWLLSPVLSMAAGTTTLSFWTMGSTYWCRVEYNNCDLEVWLVVGAIGGGDDVLIGLADPSWPVSSWNWAQATFDITAQMPRNAAIGFHYVGNDGAQVGVDDVTLDGTLVPVGLQQFTIE